MGSGSHGIGPRKFGVATINTRVCGAPQSVPSHYKPAAEHCPTALAGSTSVTAIYRQLRSGPTLTVAVCPPENKFRLVDFASETPTEITGCPSLLKPEERGPIKA